MSCSLTSNVTCSTMHVHVDYVPGDFSTLGYGKTGCSSCWEWDGLWTFEDRLDRVTRAALLALLRFFEHEKWLHKEY
eukprot:6180533-Pleurochrysis_carterae.AAC.3